MASDLRWADVRRKSAQGVMEGRSLPWECHEAPVTLQKVLWWQKQQGDFLTVWAVDQWSGVWTVWDFVQDRTTLHGMSIKSPLKVFPASHLERDCEPQGLPMSSIWSVPLPSLRPEHAAPNPGDKSQSELGLAVSPVVRVKIFYNQYGSTPELLQDLKALRCAVPLHFSHRMIGRSHAPGGGAEVAGGPWVGLAGVREVAICQPVQIYFDKFAVSGAQQCSQPNPSHVMNIPAHKPLSRHLEPCHSHGSSYEWPLLAGPS